MTEETSLSGTDLGPLVVVSGQRIELRGWRDISLINLAAVLLPTAAGALALFGGGLWRLLALALFAFSAYGCWAIFRSAIAILKLEDSEIVIDGRRIRKTEIIAFEGRRVPEPSGLDDVQSSVELWLKLKGGTDAPVIRMSGAAQIERIASYLNTRLEGQ